ncbi:MULTISPECIES: DUF4129 domain-containing protein [Chitinophagaceae]
MRKHPIFRFSISPFLFLIIGLYISTTTFAQNALQSRHFDSSQLQDWKNQRAFQYHKSPVPEIGLWDRFMEWLAHLWYRMMSTREGVASFWTIIVVLSVAIIVFFIARYKGKTNGMWSKSDKGGLELEALSEENIHKINFEEKIAEAIRTGKYRLAIRLRYLYILKILDDKGAIKWQSGKTNYDYILEVRATSSEETYALFRQISTAFDFAWYGEHDAGKEDDDTVKSIFDQLQNESLTSVKPTANERI